MRSRSWGAPIRFHVKTEPAEQIYSRPDTYDLEHAAHESDVDFFVGLTRRLRAERIVEIACGDGRVTIPVAVAACEWGGQVTGLELSPEMLTAATRKRNGVLVTWRQGDVRDWSVEAPADLIISPCASLSHLLTLDDQLSAWRQAFANLGTGGRFIVSEVMANLPVLAESMQIPPRVAVELDADRTDEGSDRRLLRYRTTRYHAHEQRATVHFLYDQFTASTSDRPDRSLSDYDGHVYFPRELQLLFVASGFEIESIWGGYRGEPLQHTSRQIIVCGRKP